MASWPPPDHPKIKTHDSESRGQEEAGRTRRTSELFTRSTALKFVNALNTRRSRPYATSELFTRSTAHESYRLVIKDSAHSNYIESVNQQWRKSAPPILSSSHCEPYGARSCAHARKTIPPAPTHPPTKQIVPSMYEESLI